MYIHPFEFAPAPTFQGRFLSKASAKLSNPTTWAPRVATWWKVYVGRERVRGEAGEA